MPFNRQNIPADLLSVETLAAQVQPPARQISRLAPTEGTVFVELGTALQKAAIARDGVQVPIVRFNPAALGDALGHTQPVVAKVVSQSIEPGVSVAKGTSIDLVLTEPTKLKVSVLQTAFQPMQDLTLHDVYTNLIRDNAVVQSVLARNDNAATLSPDDQTTLTDALGQAGHPVGTGPGQTIDAAFGTLQAAFAFGA